MIKMEEYMDIISLHRQGLTMRAISRRLGIHRSTVKKYLTESQPPHYRKRSSKQSILAPYHQMIEGWLEQDNYRGTWIYQRLKEIGYPGGYDTVKNYVRGVKAHNQRQAFIRFETIPGLQAQVDWADFKVSVPGGRDITLYLFIMVLGFSRAMYAELTTRCTLQHFMDAHMRAFRYLGGTPVETLYDNMRHVFAGKRDGSPMINVEFAHFASHFGFKPILCPPYSPWVKGKVERPIDYIRESFWRGYRFSNVESANRDLVMWLSETANRRIHGTHKQRVDIRWQQDARGLLPCSGSYDTAVKVWRKVYKDCMVAYNASRYQVPPEAVGKKVLLKIKDGRIRIYDDDRLLITHSESGEKGRWITDPAIIDQILQSRRDHRPWQPYDNGKGKATRGLSDGSLFGRVEYRPLSVYDRFCGQGGESWSS